MVAATFSRIVLVVLSEKKWGIGTVEPSSAGANAQFPSFRRWEVDREGDPAGMNDTVLDAEWMLPISHVARKLLQLTALARWI